MAPTPLTAVPYIGEKTEEKLRRKLDRSMGKAGQPVSVNEATLRKNTQVVQFVLSKRQKKELRQFDPTQSTETIEQTAGFDGSRAGQRKQRVKEGEAQPEGNLSRVDQFGEALDIFSEEYQGETTFTGPDPTTIREGVFESEAPDDFQSILPSAVNQRSFLQFPREDKFEENVEEQAGTDDAIEPAKEAFVEFVDRDIGLGPDMSVFGDFEVSPDNYEEAEEFQEDRSVEERQVDNRRRAPITTDVDRWKDNPGQFDFPGVDTPTETPDKEESDLPFR
jgi:hypothetical protein